MTDSLTAVQLALEQDMLQGGAERYRKAKERLIARNEAGDHKPYLRLTQGAIPEVSKGLQELLLQADHKGRGKTHSWVKHLKRLDVDLVSYIGLWVCWNGLSHGHDVRKIQHQIGQMVEEEVWALDETERDEEAAAMADDAKAARQARGFARAVRKAKEKNSDRRRRVESAKAIRRLQGRPYEPWKPRERIKVGEPILNAVLMRAGLFQLTKNGDNQDVLELTPEAQKLLGDMEAYQQWMEPLFLPMVVPPRPWTSFDTGCYLTPRLARRVKLVRTYDREHRDLVQSRIEAGTIKPFLDALNAIQATPWRINRRVLEVVEHHWREGTNLKKFPRRHHVPAPIFPENYEELPWQEQKRWLLLAEGVRNKNRGIDSNVVGMNQDLSVARRMADFEEFYIPHNVDFRGRVYAVCHFNEQRTDWIKGVLEFARGKPLGEEGACWLAVHIANTGDFDKVSKRSFDDRIDWVLENEDKILAVAEDPIGNDWWHQADSPFCFLAACFEWAGYRREGPTFVSHLPIPLDGSNSGLQHYSAALRSRADGAYVNLVPQDVPADIYSEVARRTREAVERDAATGDPIAKLWLDFGIDRKVVKRNVMTFAYSSEVFGFKDQLMKDLMLPLADEVLTGEREAHPFGDDVTQWAAAGYLAKKNWASVNSTVTKAAEGMKFFQSVAGALAHEGKCMVWTTPTGFPVVHKYVEHEVKVVELFLFDRKIPVLEAGPKDKVTDDGHVLRRIQANVQVRPTTIIKKSKQRSAVAPNVIHSADASHLMLTVNAAVAEGITSFCLIHDSFATHAADTARFAQIIREQFVQMYHTWDVFQSVYDTAWAQLSEKGRKKLPSVPSKGDLDLSEILRSRYCFA